MSGRSYLWSLAYLVGLVGIYIGERLIGAGQLRAIFTLGGLVVLLMAVILRAVRMGRASGERRRIERYLLLFSLIGLAGLAVYFVQSDAWLKVSSQVLSESSPKLATVLSALWPVAMLASLLPMFLIEISYAGMVFAPQVETGRIKDAALTGLGLTGAVVLAFCAVYVATARDAKWDLAYFRTTKPGQATRRVAQALTEPVEVSLFFPPANEVQQEVAEYFQDLARIGDQLKVRSYDQAVEPAKARELGVSANGAIVFARGARRETLFIGVDLERARSQLRMFDQEVQKKLLTVAQPRRAIYFTTGHGERAERSVPDEQRTPISNFRELLRSQNHELRNFGAAEGLASDVPADAAAVLVIGPTHEFLPEESAALRRYLGRGGRLLVALDPESRLEFRELLNILNLRFFPITLANDQAYVSRTHQISDRAFIGTTSFSSHPAVTSLSQLGGRAYLVLLGAGYLEEAGPRPQGMSIDFTVHAHPATWNDLNGNFLFDASEKRRAYELAAAIVQKKAGSTKPADEGRAIALADSDALADVLLDNPGNMYFALDGIKWLLGDESLAGEIATEVDVSVEHTRKQDVLWFYSTVFAAPAIVLGIGLLVTRRRRRGTASGATTGNREDAP